MLNKSLHLLVYLISILFNAMLFIYFFKLFCYQLCSETVTSDVDQCAWLAVYFMWTSIVGLYFFFKIERAKTIIRSLNRSLEENSLPDFTEYASEFDDGPCDDKYKGW